MWQKGWRDRIWSNLDKEWDIIIIGGGITGAGILCEASRRGLNALLVERGDFATGTSSRSSKLVHGGMRYLRNFQFKVTLESVSEREYLIDEGKGLVHKMDMLFASQRGDKIPAWMMGFGIIVYSLMARRWQYAHYDHAEIQDQYPLLTGENLTGGFPFVDALTDDARLTLRVIQEAVRHGGTAINYASAVDLLKDHRGRVRGIALEDHSIEGAGRTAEVRARLVISATGAWGDKLRSKISLGARLRPLRGSHLVFPHERLPLSKAINLNHPRDGRPVFVFPWEGVTVAGTTDVDAGDDLPPDPSISQLEAEYLLEYIQTAFPGQELTERDVISTWSGIRPVINTGKANPSNESREHAIWLEDGLLTVTGGKLTTFRVMARDALRVARRVLPILPAQAKECPVFDPIDQETVLEFTESTFREKSLQRFIGRYGMDCVQVLNRSEPGDMERIGPTPYHWAELRWAAKAEGVLHLDDLLLRRVRLGLLLPDGAAEYLPKIRQIAQPELGWDDARWRGEEENYLELWKRAYSSIN